MADSEPVTQGQIAELQSQIVELRTRLTPIEHNVRLLNRLERAVLQAAERGDVLAATLQAGSSESIVENLVAHFEAVPKSQVGKAQEPPPKKRLVSKRAYVAQVGSKVGLSAFGLTLCVLCFVGVLAVALAACLLPLEGYAGAFGFIGALLVAALGGVACLLMKDASGRALQKATQIKPDVPLTRANMSDLAANDSLVRASQEPMQVQEGFLLRASAGEAQESVLLRAAVGTQEGQVEAGQLLRASSGEQA